MIVIWHETVSRQRDRVSFDVLVKQTDTIEVISGIQEQSFLVSPPIVHMVGFPICEFQHVPPKYELNYLGKVITLPRCLTSHPPLEFPRTLLAHHNLFVSCRNEFHKDLPFFVGLESLHRPNVNKEFPICPEELRRIKLFLEF